MAAWKILVMAVSARLTVITLITAALICFLGLNHVGLFDVDEAIFAQASVEMNETGDYVTPHYNGDPRYHKPPLIYWLQAAALAEISDPVLAVRLPSALFALLTLISFYLFLARMTENTRFALTAAATFGSCLSFYVISHAATADMALNFFILTTTLTFIAHLYARKPDGIAPIIGGLLMAAGFLTKGPVAALVPVLAVGTLLLTKPGISGNFRRIGAVRALIAFIFGITPWLYLMIDAKGLAFFTEFWLVHNWGRFSDGMGNSQSGSPFYYPIVLTIGFFPWVLLLPTSIVATLRGFSAKIRSRTLLEVLPAIGLVWFTGVVMFFSFSATKLPHYILPALPGAALMIAGRLEHIWQRPLNPWQLVWMLPVILILPVAFILLPYLPDLVLGNTANLPKVLQSLPLTPLTGQKAAVWQQQITIGFASQLLGFILLVGTLAGFARFCQKRWDGVLFWGGSMAITLLTVTFHIIPPAYQFMQQPLTNIAHKLTTDFPVYYMAIHQPSVRFISGIPFTPVHQPDEIAAPAQVVFKAERRAVFMGQHPAAQLFCEGGYCLATVE